MLGTAATWLGVFAQDDVGGAGSGAVFGAAEAEFEHVDAGEKGFAGAEKDGGGCEVEFVDEAGAKILPNRGDTSADADVFSICGGEGAVERGMNAVGDEMKRGAAGHFK